MSWLLLAVVKGVTYGGFAYVNSVSVVNDRVFLATAGGVVVYGVDRKVEKSLVTDDPVELALGDPFGSDLFFVAGGGLYRWGGNVSSDPLRIASVPGANSLGAGLSHIFVETSGLMLSFTKGGAKVNRGPGAEVVWCGERADAKTDDIRVVFLSPFTIFSPRMGNVPVTAMHFYNRELFVATGGLGVYVYDANSKLLKDSLVPGPHFTRVYDLAADGEGRVWLGGDGGLAAFDGKRFTGWRKGGASFQCADVVSVTYGDRLYLAGEQCGLFELRDENLFWKLNEAGRVTALYYDGEQLWVGTEGGVRLLYSGANRTELLESTRGLYITDIAGSERSIYLVTDRGVLRLDRESREWERLSDPGGLLEIYASGVGAVGVDGPVAYVVTSGGLVAFDERDGSYTEVALPADPGQVLSVAARNGYVAVGAASGLYVARPGEGLMKVWRADGLADDYVEAVLISGGKLFAGTRGGLSVFGLE